MNEFQHNLYANLMALTSNEAFYYQDFVLDGKTYRIFNYRLASYSDFLLPDALQCRGTMFEVNQQNEPIRLAALPMEKFFNLNENPMTMNMDLSQIVEVQEKADGSLMSTYLHDGQLRLKSKGSLFSDQALAAMKWLEDPKQRKIKMYLKSWTELGWTVNLEWCSPEHRIVLGYMEPQLRVLNCRDLTDGRYSDTLGALIDWAVEKFPVDNPIEFINKVSSMQDIEGFVVKFASGQKVKIKTEWYLSLHHAKDSVNNPRRLFEAILDEGIDDLRSLFFSDPLVMRMIDEMQVKVDHVYNSMVNAVEQYYAENKHLDRKEYAIKGQQDSLLKSGALSYFGLAMNKYVGKEVNYKEFLKSKWRDLGLKDTTEEKNDEYRKNTI